MRILLYSDYHLSAYIGGNELYCDGIATALAQADYTVSYAALSVGKYDSQHYQVIKLPRALHRFVPAAWKIIRHIDVLHTSGAGWRHCLLAILAVLAKKTIRIHSFLAPSTPRTDIRRWLSKLEVPCIRLVYTHILTINTRDRKLFPRHKKLGRCRYIAPMLSSEREALFQIHGEREAKHEGTFVYVGTLDTHHYYKGLDLLLETLSAQGDTYHLVVVGDGDSRRSYEAKTRQLGLSQYVTFLGRIPDDSLATILRSDVILVLPSISVSEGFGKVVVEALLSGARVVTTSMVGIAADLDATLVSIASPTKESLGAAIATARHIRTGLRAKQARRSLGMRFASTRMIPKLYQFYASLTAERP